MFQITITDGNNARRQEIITGTAALIGKSRDCQVRLGGWRVGKEHARIFRTKTGLFIQDLGQFSGTLVNGARVEQHGPLGHRDEILLGGYVLTVQDQLTHPDGGHETAAAQTLPEAPGSRPVPAARAQAGGRGTSSHDYWRAQLHERLLETIDLRRRDLNTMDDRQLRQETERMIRELIEAESALPDALDRERLVRDILNEAVGLGPLEELLADEAITEIMVNRHDEIYVERAGRLACHPSSFTSDRAVLRIIERIVAPIGRRIDESSPMVDARLADGSRVNAIIPPLSLKGPTLTIRKFARRVLTAEDLIGMGAFSPAMAAFLRLCVVERKNIIVSGGTGSGKTTLLNVLSNYIPDGERIITIEDAAELRLAHSHLVSLESRPANAEGRGQIAIRDLVKNALRMRPDRIVVGECRGGEALDMLQAMNTGHEGSLTTLHANSPRDALARLETLILMAGMELPLSAIRDQIASAVDIIVQQARVAGGRRLVTGIVEVTGMESGKIQLQELFRFEPRGLDADGRQQGVFSGCEAVPSFYEGLTERGVDLDLAIFNRVAAP
jgi:pilus assembly protein CpaF